MVVAACAPLGDLLIVAPAAQQTASGRSKPPGSSGRIELVEIVIAGEVVLGYGVDGSPAQAVEHALFELAPRRVDLAVAGINYGENIGETITTSGTVSAALEAASFGVPALASPRRRRLSTTSTTMPTSILQRRAISSAGLLATVLAAGLPPGVDVLKIDIPEGVMPATPCRWTRLSRRRYFYPVAPQRTALD